MFESLLNVPPSGLTAGDSDVEEVIRRIPAERIEQILEEALLAAADGNPDKAKRLKRKVIDALRRSHTDELTLI